MDHYIFAGDRNAYLDGPRLQDPNNIPDIPALAHALSQINRFTGHTVRPYSVAEHSLLCCEIARNQPIVQALPRKDQARVMLACLTHDLHEALVGDVSSPIKHIVGKAWTDFEDRVERAVLDAHGLLPFSEEFCELVKHVDLIALATEKRDLLDTDSQWRVLEGIEPAGFLSLSRDSTATPAYWARQFVECYLALWKVIRGENQ